MNKLETKNELSNFGEQAKKIWNSGLGVKHQNQKFMLLREAPKKFRIWTPHEENHSYTPEHMSSKKRNISSSRPQ